jgi:hypothetical protein
VNPPTLFFKKESVFKAPAQAFFAGSLKNAFFHYNPSLTGLQEKTCRHHFQKMTFILV